MTIILVLSSRNYSVVLPGHMLLYIIIDSIKPCLIILVLLQVLSTTGEPDLGYIYYLQ